MAYSHDSQSSAHEAITVNEGEENLLEDIEKLKSPDDEEETQSTRGRAMSSFSGQINAPIEDGATVTSVTLNLIGGGLGTGILSMPWGMAGGSVFVSLAVLAVVLAVNAFTIMILIHAGDKYKQFELGCLLGMLPGKLGEYSQLISNFLVWATLWGVLIGYYIVIQQQLVPFMPEDNATLGDKKIWAAVAACVAIPLCFLNTKYLSFTSTLSVVVNVYLFGVLIALLSDGVSKEEHKFCWVGFGPGIVTFSSLMQYGVIIQFCVLPMYKEMEIKNRTPAAFGKALGIAFSFLFVLFSAFAVVGYMTYGSNVESDILDNFPTIHAKHKTSLNIPSNIAKIGMVLVVLGVYPLMMLPMISPVREYEKRKRAEAALSPKSTDQAAAATDGELAPGAYKSAADATFFERQVAKSPRFLSSVSIILISVTSCAASFVVDDLGELNAISGAAQASFFVGIFPTLIAYHLLLKQSQRWKVGLCFLLVACCVLSLMGFVFKDNYHAKLDGDSCMWRGSIGSNSTRREL